MPGDFDDPQPPEGDGEAGDANDPGLRGRATDFVKRALGLGVGAIFMGEEGIRNAVSDLKLPKEFLSALLSQADRTKQEVVRTLGEEVRRFLESAALHEELARLLTDMTIEVKAELKFKPGEPGQPMEFIERPQVTLKRPAKRKGGA